MADIWGKAKRSEVMSLIRSRGNKETELHLLAILRRHRITGWRRGQKLLGKPDFLFPRERVAIFVDGCFWHGCPRCYRRPSSNRGYWDAKFQRNRTRDREVTRELKKLGWTVVRIWQHTLRTEAATVSRIKSSLKPRSVKSLLSVLNRTCSVSSYRSTSARA